jgi:hypothetical protein
VDDAEIVVARDSAAQLSAPLRNAGGTVALSVDGPQDGLFLWGAPHLRTGNGDDFTALPPVVLITLDTTRRDALSVYGAPAAASPALDAFARKATVFTNAHAASPWTLASHGAIFTGLYPSQGTWGASSDSPPAGVETMAGLLRRRGYFAAGLAGGELCSSRWGLGSGFHLFRDPEGFETRGDELTDAALEILELYHDLPLFLFVNYFDPHALYRAPVEFQNRFAVEEHAERVRHLPLWGDLASGDGGPWGAIIAGRAEVTSDVRSYLRSAYLAEVAFMDHEFGRLLEGLRRHGLFEEALIIVVADHGEFLGEHGFFSHACRLDRELIEVPLIVKWPRQSEGSQADELVSHVDLLPTILAVLGIESEQPTGISLHDSAALAVRSEIFMEEHEVWFHPLFDNMRIAPHLYGIQRRQEREIVWDGGSECETVQQGNWREQACDRPWTEVLTEVGRTLTVFEPAAEPEGGLSEDEIAKLEALGYLEPD